MTETRTLTAIGLMSGTSMDGIDVALLRTDGEQVEAFGPAATYPYDDATRRSLRGVLGRTRDDDGKVAEAARLLSLRHVEAVERFLAANDLAADQIDVIGFHGHTIAHAPERRFTWQIGYGELLADALGIETVAGFRVQDVVAGGQGAPLVPVYHAALAERLERPLCVLNVGGVANLTWIGGDGGPIACDTGPGNALLDDWAARHTGSPVDTDGRLALAGRVDPDALARLLDHPYFALPPPKSLDRDAFDPAPLAGLSAADGAATLAAFTARAVALCAGLLPEAPRRWLVCGGGRRNPALMAALASALAAPVEPVEAVGWDGDALEAQAFAFLAVRCLRGLPITFPGTTGAARPLTGGRRHHPNVARHGPKA